MSRGGMAMKDGTMSKSIILFLTQMDARDPRIEVGEVMLIGPSFKVRGETVLVEGKETEMSRVSMGGSDECNAMNAPLYKETFSEVTELIIEQWKEE